MIHIRAVNILIFYCLSQLEEYFIRNCHVSPCLTDLLVLRLLLKMRLHNRFFAWGLKKIVIRR